MNSTRGKKQMRSPDVGGYLVMRIVIADDHDIVRRGVRQLLRERPDWEVCGEAVTGRIMV